MMIRNKPYSTKSFGRQIESRGLGFSFSLSVFAFSSHPERRCGIRSRRDPLIVCVQRGRVAMVFVERARARNDTERKRRAIFRMVRAKRSGGDRRAVCARAARGGTASRGDAQSRLSQSSADIRAITLSTVLKISSGARGVAPQTVIDNVRRPIRHRSYFLFARYTAARKSLDLACRGHVKEKLNVPPSRGSRRFESPLSPPPRSSGSVVLRSVGTARCARWVWRFVSETTCSDGFRSGKNGGVHRPLCVPWLSHETTINQLSIYNVHWCVAKDSPHFPCFRNQRNGNINTRVVC